MAYNTFETVDNSLRGEPYGQLTPEGQKLWDEYQSLLGGQKNAPMANLRLRSGATMPIIEPGFGLKNRMLSKTLGGMTGTGLGDRAKAQPGLFGQLAPLFIAAGIKDPKTIQKLLSMFSGGSGSDAIDTTNLPSGGMGGDDWGDLGADAFSDTSNYTDIGDYSDSLSGVDWDLY